MTDAAKDAEAPPGASRPSPRAHLPIYAYVVPLQRGQGGSRSEWSFSVTLFPQLVQV